MTRQLKNQLEVQLLADHLTFIHKNSISVKVGYLQKLHKCQSRLSLKEHISASTGPF